MRGAVRWSGLAITALVVAGCTGLGGSNVPLPVERESPMAGVLRARDAQLATLRAQLAAAHIASAKQEAELAALREQIAHLRREGIESRQRILELHHAVEEAQASQAVPPPAFAGASGSQPGADSAPVAEVPDWQSAVATLTQEVEQLKGELAKVMSRSEETNSGLSAGRQPPSLDVMIASGGGLHPIEESIAVYAVGTPVDPVESALSASSRITVAPGDSLWSLARKHRTTVERLRRTNQLASTRLHIGQILILSPARSIPSDR